MSAAGRPVPAKKAAGADQGGADGAAVLKAAALAAVGALADPRVRQQLIEFGAGLNDSVRARKSARRAARSNGQPAEEAGPRSHALRQRRLEHRADRLSENLELLRLSSGEESAAALTSVSEVVGRVRLALAVANNLPLRRRIAAQREIAEVLETLEAAVLRAAMPGEETTVDDQSDESSDEV